MGEDYYKTIFSKNLKKYMELNGKTQIDLINDLGFNKSAVSTWCNGTRLPRMDKVDALAKYFGISRSDLIEEKAEIAESYYLNDDAKELAQFLFDNPEYKVLFDASRKVKREDIEFVKTFNDYMITASIDDIDKLGFVSKISANKMELYDAVNAYMNYPEYFEFLKENSSEELQKAIPVLEEILKNDNDGKKLEKINDYLIDNADDRAFSEFLCELR